MDIINKLFIKLCAKKVGNDEFGNQYYQNKTGKRFVIYNGMAEPSKIPMTWHGWMHYYEKEIPNQTSKHFWEKTHLPNLSGTKNSYSPKNSTNQKTSSDYQPWNPNS